MRASTILELLDGPAMLLLGLTVARCSLGDFRLGPEPVVAAARDANRDEGKDCRFIFD